jgi:hypothetical protein
MSLQGRNWRFLAIPADVASLARGKTARIRKPPFYPLNYGDGKKGKSKKDEGRSPAAAPSAAEQARVEIVVDRRMNADAFEVRMLGI